MKTYLFLLLANAFLVADGLVKGWKWWKLIPASVAFVVVSVFAAIEWRRTRP